MSQIYSAITYICRNLTITIKESFLFNLIFKILNFIEKKWINSFFKTLYPNENFLSIFKRSKILKKNIFAPLIVIVVFSIFLLLSLQKISNSLVISLFLGFISFIIGAMILPKFFINHINENNYLKFKKLDIYGIGFCLVLVGIIFFIISIVSVRGIPLIQNSIRYNLKPIFTMPVFLIIPGIGLLGSYYLNQFKNKLINRSQVRFRFLILTLFGCGLLLLLAYRTPLIALFLLMIIMAYLGEIISIWEVVIGAFLGVCGIIGIGYFRSLNELTLSKNISPIYSLQSRADFTLHVLNLLDMISGNFGIMHGEFILKAIPGSDIGPRMMVGKLIAWRSEVTITPTLIGPMLIDFGKAGVIAFMGLLGFLLGIGHKIVKITKDYFYIFIYSILITYTILGVETAILDIQVICYFLIGAFIYFINIIYHRIN